MITAKANIYPIELQVVMELLALRSLSKGTVRKSTVGIVTDRDVRLLQLFLQCFPGQRFPGESKIKGLIRKMIMFRNLKEKKIMSTSELSAVASLLAATAVTIANARRIANNARVTKVKKQAESVHGVANSALNGVHNRGTALDSPLTSSQERRGAVRGEMLPRHLLSALDAAESEPEAAISTAPARAARAATEARAVAVALMQAVSRGRAQRAAPARRAARAAALMQAVSKGYLQRAPARAEARRVRAAALMQAVIRGHLQRAPARAAATNSQFRWRVITTVALFAIAGLAFVCYSERCQGFRDGLRDRVVNLSHKWIGKIGNI